MALLTLSLLSVLFWSLPCFLLSIHAYHRLEDPQQRYAISLRFLVLSFLIFALLSTTSLAVLGGTLCLIFTIFQSCVQDSQAESIQNKQLIAALLCLGVFFISRNPLSLLILSYILLPAFPWHQALWSSSAWPHTMSAALHFGLAQAPLLALFRLSPFLHQAPLCQFIFMILSLAQVSYWSLSKKHQPMLKQRWIASSFAQWHWAVALLCLGGLPLFLIDVHMMTHSLAKCLLFLYSPHFARNFVYTALSPCSILRRYPHLALGTGMLIVILSWCLPLLPYGEIALAILGFLAYWGAKVFFDFSLLSSLEHAVQGAFFTLMWAAQQQIFFQFNSFGSLTLHSSPVAQMIFCSWLVGYVAMGVYQTKMFCRDSSRFWSIYRHYLRAFP